MTGGGGTPRDEDEGGIILFRRWDDGIQRPGVDSVVFLHADQDI